MKFILALSFFTFSPFLCAYEKEFVITQILSDEVIKIEKLDPNIEIESGDILLIYSHESKTVLGYARAELVNLGESSFTATIETHNKSGIIRPENFLRKADLTSSSNENFPARHDLFYHNEKKVSSKYRPLVYTGIAQGFTASNLVKNEYLVGPSMLSYGITSRFQVNTNLISIMFNIPNLSLKNTLYKNDEFEFSVENGFQFFPEKKRGSYQLTAYLDMVTNSSFNSFMKLRVFTQKPEDEYLYNSDEYLKNLNLELSLSYGYLFSNWNRLLFGPKVDVNKKKVGGVIGYYIVDKEFHTMLGVSSNDFSLFEVGKQGYLLNLDFWWRF